MCSVGLYVSVVVPPALATVTLILPRVSFGVSVIVSLPVVPPTARSLPSIAIVVTFTVMPAEVLTPPSLSVAVSPTLYVPVVV